MQIRKNIKPEQARLEDADSRLERQAFLISRLYQQGKENNLSYGPFPYVMLGVLILIPLSPNIFNFCFGIDILTGFYVANFVAFSIFSTIHYRKTKYVKKLKEIFKEYPPDKEEDV